jgi:hypothetical protein
MRFSLEQTLQTDKQFRVSGDWALASDGMQWVIQRRRGQRWEAVKFIHSTKDWLAYRLTRLAPPDDVERLLVGLPDTFQEWADKEAPEGCHDDGRR